MSVSIQTGQSVSALASHPTLADLTPSSAVLSSVSLSSSDATVFTISPDPSTTNGFIIVSVGAGTAQVSGTATATETDGTTHQISMTPDTVTVTAAPPPPPPQATAFGLAYGTPFTT